MRLKFSMLFILFVTSFSFSQITSRVIIEGKISAPIGDDVEGIVVYNRSTGKGTISNEKGEFKISAGISDRIDVTAMQYQKFTVIVDKGIVSSKRLNIFLSESVNLLDEVVVTPYDLLGNVAVDVKKISVSSGKISEVAELTAAPINDADYEWKPDQYSQVQSNIRMNNTMVNGLNFVNLFKLAFKKSHSKADKEDIDVSIRNMYDDQFFKTNLALEIDEVNDFIYFAEANGLNESYLKKGKELDLIELLITQSELYKKQQ